MYGSNHLKRGGHFAFSPVPFYHYQAGTPPQVDFVQSRASTRAGATRSEQIRTRDDVHLGGVTGTAGALRPPSDKGTRLSDFSESLFLMPHRSYEDGTTSEFLHDYGDLCRPI